MNIPKEEWQQASGSFCVDSGGRVWQIIGFIDRPAVILDRVHPAPEEYALGDARSRETVIMGTEHSREWKRLIPQENAA